MQFSLKLVNSLYFWTFTCIVLTVTLCTSRCTKCTNLALSGRLAVQSTVSNLAYCLICRWLKLITEMWIMRQCIFLRQRGPWSEMLPSNLWQVELNMHRNGKHVVGEGSKCFTVFCCNFLTYGLFSELRQKSFLSMLPGHQTSCFYRLNALCIVAVF